MIDLTKPEHVIVITMCSTMLLSLGILYLASPFWIKKINDQGKVVISGKLIISYSLTFAIVCSLAAFIVIKKEKDQEEVVK